MVNHQTSRWQWRRIAVAIVVMIAGAVLATMLEQSLDPLRQSPLPYPLQQRR